MTLADRRDARLQGVEIERPRQTSDFDDVVIVPGRIEPAQHIDSLLLERQADAWAIRSRIAQARVIRAAGLSFRCSRRAARARNGRRIEDILEREIGSKACPQTRKHLRHRKGVRAEREDILVDADLD